MAERAPAEMSELEHVERLFARGFVILGGLFWVAAAFSGPYIYSDMSLASSLQTAIWPFLAAVVTLVIGWTYERLAALLLFGASSAVVVWGILYYWEIGVWVIVSFVLIGPMMLAAALFSLSARSEARRAITTEVRAAAQTRKAIRVPPSAKVQPDRR